ncbi:MAG: hypothetical protein AAFY60_02160, partial [Myxococcota bacterium]
MRIPEMETRLTSLALRQARALEEKSAPAAQAPTAQKKRAVPSAAVRPLTDASKTFARRGVSETTVSALTPGPESQPLSHTGSSSPLAGLFGCDDRQLKVFESALTDRQRKILADWQTATANTELDPKQALVALLSHRCSPEPADGCVTYQALRKLGVITDYLHAVVEDIRREKGPEPLKKLAVVLNVHWLEDMVPLVPVLSRLGAERVSKYRGSPDAK